MAQQRNNRKDDILRVATGLFRARGYHGTRMDDVADGVKLNKATVYYHFKSKADILNAIYLKATAESLGVLEAIDETMPPAAALRSLAERELLLIARDLDQASVYFQEAPFVTEWLSRDQVDEIRRRERLFERGIHRLVARGFNDGSFSGGDPALVAVAYLGMTSWFYRWYDPERSGKPGQIAASIAQIFLHGILAPGAPGGRGLDVVDQHGIDSTI